jgi:hypothetical protein
MTVTEFGSKAAHISWAVFVLMLLVKLARPETPWLYVFLPFMVPTICLVLVMMAVALLYGLAHLLGAFVWLLKRLRGRA